MGPVDVFNVPSSILHLKGLGINRELAGNQRGRQRSSPWKSIMYKTSDLI